jgi:pimeloyl-ACP methyl ester carboxylesterase
MATSFVLVHSPSVGPRTWEPVARRLTELGWEAAVPSLLGVGQQGPPFWSRVVDAVRAGLDTSGQKQGVVLVAHSNIGLFIPVIAAALPGRVLGWILVDTALPPPPGRRLSRPRSCWRCCGARHREGCCRGGPTGGMRRRWPRCSRTSRLTRR